MFSLPRTDDSHAHCSRTATVVSNDGKEFKLTPDLLTIERKTLKQTST